MYLVKNVFTGRTFMKKYILFLLILCVPVQSSRFEGVHAGVSVGYYTFGSTVDVYGPEMNAKPQVIKRQDVNHEMSGFQGLISLAYLKHVSAKYLIGVDARWGLITGKKTINLAWRTWPNTYKITLGDQRLSTVGLTLGRIYDKFLMFSVKLGGVYRSYNIRYHINNPNIGKTPGAVKTNGHGIGILAGVGALHSVSQDWSLGLDYSYHHYLGRKKSVIESRDFKVAGIYRDFRIRPSRNHSISFTLRRKIL